MQPEACYHCHQQGHCPLKSSKTKHSTSTPEVPASISSNLEERMGRYTCFSCRQLGHWSWYCPSKYSKTKHDQSTPNVPANISPNLEERMRQSKCHSCGQRGHWSWYCPSKSSKGNAKSISPPSRASPKHVSSVFSNTTRCDDAIIESDLQPPPFEYPVCACKAGVCRRVKGRGSHDAFKYFFCLPH